MDPIFTGKNKKKTECLTFSRFTCFLNGIFPFLSVNFLVLLSQRPFKKSDVLPLACLHLKFSLGYAWLSTNTFEQKVIIMLNVLSVHWFY